MMAAGALASFFGNAVLVYALHLTMAPADHAGALAAAPGWAAVLTAITSLLALSCTIWMLRVLPSRPWRVALVAFLVASGGWTTIGLLVGHWLLPAYVLYGMVAGGLFALSAGVVGTLLRRHPR